MIEYFGPFLTTFVGSDRFQWLWTTLNFDILNIQDKNINFWPLYYQIGQMYFTLGPYLTILNIILWPFYTTSNQSFYLFGPFDLTQTVMTTPSRPLQTPLDLGPFYPFRTILVHIHSTYLQLLYETMEGFQLNSVKASSLQREVITDDRV